MEDYIIIDGKPFFPNTFQRFPLEGEDRFSNLTYSDFRRIATEARELGAKRDRQWYLRVKKKLQKKK